MKHNPEEMTLDEITKTERKRARQVKIFSYIALFLSIVALVIKIIVLIAK